MMTSGPWCVQKTKIIKEDFVKWVLVFITGNDTVCPSLPASKTEVYCMTTTSHKGPRNLDRNPRQSVVYEVMFKNYVQWCLYTNHFCQVVQKTKCVQIYSRKINFTNEPPCGTQREWRKQTVQENNTKNENKLQRRRMILNISGKQSFWCFNLDNLKSDIVNSCSRNWQ